MKEKMEKYSIVSIILAFINSIFGIIAFFMLKGDIPIQWSGNEVSRSVGKNYILVFPVIAVILVIFAEKMIYYVSYKWFRNANDKIVSFINMFLQIVLLTIQAYIILYIVGLRISIAVILIVELVIGIIYAVRLKNN